jgi:hypothetical protein
MSEIGMVTRSVSEGLSRFPFNGALADARRSHITLADASGYCDAHSLYCTLSEDRLLTIGTDRDDFNRPLH